jgi:hypothetical protein
MINPLSYLVDFVDPLVVLVRKLIVYGWLGAAGSVYMHATLGE